ncbi:diguanylate cyclase (GGDEF)-like protein [Stella humosa]|uniref:Diguanylate cyclase (GGDEF)-like protein n=1 Tax=Stella humosa TaxID=94 RepID=A0A3N1M8Q2_9PROT|nr:EAL domain-containing protein [Stella humosa]ROP99588.1 diguanylate cyclase (GGDEF)-like protein [Stella humosa]BBK31187.1 hypothetical protein STHU_18210 [Stella humosa]
MNAGPAMADDGRLSRLLVAQAALIAADGHAALMAELCRSACAVGDATWSVAVIHGNAGQAPDVGVPDVWLCGLAGEDAARLRQAFEGPDPFAGRPPGTAHLAVGDLPQVRQGALLVPLGGDGPHGWLVVADRKDGAGFDARDEILLQGVARLATALHRPILTRHRLQSEIAEEVEQRKRAQRRLDIQYAVAAVLADTTSLDEAAPSLLEAICVRLGFAFGILREVDRPYQVLRTVAVWHEPDPVVAAFAEGSRQQTFGPGAGMTGRAWQTGQPIWFEDGASAAEFRRGTDAERAGLHAAAAFPVFARGEVVGVLAFLARSARPPDADLMEMFATLGSQLGQFVERRRQEAEIGRLNRLYAVLSAVNRLLIKAPDRDHLFAGACRIAQEQGGFGFAGIGSYDPGSGRVTMVAGAGAGAEELSALPGGVLRDVPPNRRGEVGRAVLEGRAAFENDLTADPDLGGARRRVAIRQGYRSSAALPLTLDGQLFGVFVLFSRSNDFFSERTLALLQEVADDISFGLDYIRNRDRLAYLAHHDPLTGLPNRVLFEDRLGQALIKAGRGGSQVAVILIDIRRFRDVNNSLGRLAGDRLLQQLAERLRSAVQIPENLARLDAGQFATFLPDAGDALDIARRIETGFADVLSVPLPIGDQTLHLSGAVGVAVYPGDGTDVPTLLRNVEAALVNAKATGRRFLFYQPSFNARVADTLRMVGRLRLALERGEFALHYQPKVDAKDPTIRSVEALIRWRDAEKGFVPPVEFIPLLEESGLILDVGYWVIRQALTDRRAWRAAGRKPPRVAVNVSVVQFQAADFVDGVRRLLTEFGGPEAGGDGMLDIEITESLIMTDVVGTIAKLHELRRLGVDLAVDDFGTGHSSLAYLARLPIHALKIDRSFVRMMVEQSESMMIISTIIALGHGLDLKVVAEGVETEEQAKLLRLMRCDQLQGYYVARPMPAAKLAELLPTA